MYSLVILKQYKITSALIGQVLIIILDRHVKKPQMDFHYISDLSDLVTICDSGFDHIELQFVRVH